MHIANYGVEILFQQVGVGHQGNRNTEFLYVDMIGELFSPTICPALTLEETPNTDPSYLWTVFYEYKINGFYLAASVVLCFE